MITNQRTFEEIILKRSGPGVAMVAMVATRQKACKCGSSLPFECRHALGESRTLPRSACAGVLVRWSRVWVGSRGMATMATMATPNRNLRRKIKKGGRG